MKCLIWGTGYTFYQYFNSIKYYEMLGEIEIVGVTSNIAQSGMLGYQHFHKDNIKKVNFDVVIIMAQGKLFHEIRKEAVELGIAENKIISYKIFTMPNADIKKYIKIVNDKVTIFANNCWGAVVYNRLGLQFKSPFINMFEHDKDYIKFLQNPYKYMKVPLVLKENRFSSELKYSYPVCWCDDILLYFNHYLSFEEANESWEKRKKRINWDNLFVMMYTKDEEIAREFSKLPYKKKICFVPFQMEGEGIFSISMQNYKEPFFQVVNSSMCMKYAFYDILELLDSGKIVSLID